jgi:molybdopterin converting factor small subunit
MVEIRYGDQYEVTELAGQTVSEARQQFRDELGIPDKARAKLNGRNIKRNVEPDTVLNDDDKLSFAVSRSKVPFLVGALLLALAATGGVFAFGFINATATLNGTVASSNFADVSVNSTGISALSWNGYGFFKGAIGGPYGIFNIDTTSGYTGDLVVTVSLGNADQLAKRYRVLALKLDMIYPNGTNIDINEDGTIDANEDWVMLTLDNGSVSMFPKGTANVTNVRVVSGFYITNVFPFGGWQGSAQPNLFCEVAQR